MNAEQINAWKQTAWSETRAELSALEESVRAEVETPASEAKGEAEQIVDAVKRSREAIVPYIIAHLVRSEAALAAAVVSGAILGPEADALQGSLRSFVLAASQNRRARCQRLPCTWRGEVADAGPVGTCPMCGKAPVSVLEVVLGGANRNGQWKP